MAKKVNASHILVGSKEFAEELIAKLNSGSTFEGLAQTHSKCPSGKKGGSLGWFARGQMVREFENAAFSMKKGEISKPIKTQFGWHIIKVNDVE
jgi:peptidyl-prolyl cis-trans isomerase C